MHRCFGQRSLASVPKITLGTLWMASNSVSFRGWKSFMKEMLSSICSMPRLFVKINMFIVQRNKRFFDFTFRAFA